MIGNGVKTPSTHQLERHIRSCAINSTDGLTRAICLALTSKASVLTGTEFRYTRQGGMALSQPALGKMMGVDGQSVARWEKTGKVPKWADKLLRLLYAAHANGHEPICQAIERLRIVDRLVKQRIVVQESPHGWQPILQELLEPKTAVNLAMQPLN